ncbi:hypothetical protein COV23_01065 [Candidatus Wolfebacteria bacterium CG10_big_fil_rev_8_21_14_0_10_31_9]|uniref:DUF4349 domain-containing protein n=1 Tax=Candidatus Wolfebacteria bacterium CG10_big_fil_rev_8_21_14_0_10_31_9 TaxID=1975070 RepID=A0A2H0REL3_9BACT|nr:MAG: hypothetical protein COV23_01065 [Candidatus Wolfebacteria bacterium CG10_big_fil_rev_8_21_14_0_10_31_9]
MKNKFLIISILVIISIFAISSTYALAKNSTSSNKIKDHALNKGTSTTSTIDQDDRGNRGQSTSSASTEGQINAEQHRSAVANFIQSLLKTASSTEGGIGQQVKVIAQQQNQSASTTIQLIETVQSRSKVKTFFFGTNYKNMGTLRVEIVQTRNRLDQLSRLLNDTKNEADKTELKNQIQVLEKEEIKIEDFIKAQESKFSLFGWLVKLFNE